MIKTSLIKKNLITHHIKGYFFIIYIFNNKWSFNIFNVFPFVSLFYFFFSFTLIKITIKNQLQCKKNKQTNKHAKNLISWYTLCQNIGKPNLFLKKYRNMKM